MPKNPSFKPSVKRTASGRVLYRLTIPARFSGNGRRKDMYYPTKAAAEADAVVLRETMRQGTLGLLTLLTPEQARQAVEAFQRLDGARLSLLEAVDIALAQREVLDACKDYSAEGELDCTDCSLAFAVLLFAGVRPKEFSRLSWNDVQPQADGSLLLFVGGSKAKTKTSRFVHVRPNLRAFFDAWQGERVGKLAPPNWERKVKLVRARAGFSARKDTARHSFASYALAAGEPLDAVKVDMGHAHGSNVLFTNYRAAATPAAASEYWSIVPTSGDSVPVRGAHMRED